MLTVVSLIYFFNDLIVLNKWFRFCRSVLGWFSTIALYFLTLLSQSSTRTNLTQRSTRSINQSNMQTRTLITTTASETVDTTIPLIAGQTAMPVAKQHQQHGAQHTEPSPSILSKYPFLSVGDRLS